jgi:serine/threonine protein kinase
MDVKGGNIVYSQKEKKAKLIDWGLAINYRNPNETPNDELEQYSIMVNQPLLVCCSIVILCMN